MSEISFKHEKCNGWGIYNSEYIDAEDARNIHVAEGIVEDDLPQDRKFYVNLKHETICGRKLVDKDRRVGGFSKCASEIRSKLAKLQNDGNEVCGTCVSHFYADSEP